MNKVEGKIALATSPWDFRSMMTFCCKKLILMNLFGHDFAPEELFCGMSPRSHTLQQWESDY